MKRQCGAHFASARPGRWPGRAFVRFHAARRRYPAAAECRVDQDEESIDGLSRIAWRRLAAFIHLQAIAICAPTQQMVPINPADLDTALELDLQTS